MTAKAVSALVSRTFAVTYTPHAMAKVLGRLGFVYKLPKCVPAKASEETQRKFVGETLAPLMRAANDDTPLYFVDGAHPSYTGHASHGWIRRGETRELKSNHGRVNVNINGALRWPDRTVVHREAGEDHQCRDDPFVRGSAGQAPRLRGDRGGDGQRPVQPLEGVEGVARGTRRADQAGVPAGLCPEPEPDRAVFGG